MRSLPSLILMSLALVAAPLVLGGVFPAGAPAARAQDAPQDDLAALFRQAKEAAENTPARVDAEIALAQALERDGRWLDAAGAWSRAVDSGAGRDARLGRGRALTRFADVLIARGEIGMGIKAAFEDARAALREARANGVDTPEVAVLLAHCAAGVGETQEELRELREAAERYAESTTVRRALAYALLNAGEHEVALQRFRVLSEAQPEDKKLAIALAFCARQTGNEELALLGARRAIAIDPRGGDGWLAVWRIYSAEKRFGELAEQMLKLVGEFGDSAVGAHWAGFACSSARRFDEALTWLRKAVELRPTNHNARLEIARILRDERRDMAAATALYEEVLAADPSNSMAQIGLSFVAQSLGNESRHAEAVPLFETLARANPDQGSAWANLGLALRWSGRYDEAVAAYERAASVDEGDAQIWNDFGLLLLVMHRDEDAARAFATGHEQDPRHNDGPENLAFMARERGDLAAAEEWFRTAWQAARRRGDDDIEARHRRNVDDVHWPLPPVPLAR